MCFDLEFNTIFYRFCLHLGLQNPPKMAPESSKIAPTSDVKRSLFRDAMEITPDSSKVNGPHSFWITNMATHIFRSTVSIDLPLVALIIKVRSAT